MYVFYYLIFFLVPKPWVMFGLGNGLDQWSNGTLHGDSILSLPFLHLAFFCHTNLVAMKSTPMLCHTNVSTGSPAFVCPILHVSQYCFWLPVCAPYLWYCELGFGRGLSTFSMFYFPSWFCYLLLQCPIVYKKRSYSKRVMIYCHPNKWLFRSFLFFLAFKKIPLLSLRKKGKYPSICM